MRIGHLYSYFYGRGNSGGAKYYDLPAAFVSAGFTNNIWQVGNELFTDYDFEELKNSITGNTAYIDPDAPGGGDGSEENPYNSLSTALANTNFNIYLFKSGSWINGINSQVTIPNGRPIRFGIYGGSDNAKITSKVDLTFTQNETYPSVYQAGNAQTSLTIGSVMDESNIDDDGIAVGLIRRTTVELVSDNPNSFYYDADADILYVHTFDSRAPDESIHTFLSSTTLRVLRIATSVSGGSKFFMENIDVYGGFPFAIQNSSNDDDYLVGFDNCKFSYGGQSNGFNCAGNCKGFIRNCRSDYNIQDGFNYNHDKGLIFEWFCKSRNSTTISSSNNGSTSHDAFYVIRVGGEYLHHAGKAVQDINNSRTYSLRCIAGFSNADGADHTYSYATNSSSGTTEVWWIECQAVGPEGRGFWNFDNSIANIYDGDVGNLLTKDNREDTGCVTNILTEGDVYK